MSSAAASALAFPAIIAGRTLYRFVLRAAHNASKVRTCDQWHASQANAEASAGRVAIEWGGKRPMKVALCYPVPAAQSQHGLIVVGP